LGGLATELKGAFKAWRLSQKPVPEEHTIGRPTSVDLACALLGLTWLDLAYPFLA